MTFTAPPRASKRAEPRRIAVPLSATAAAATLLCLSAGTVHAQQSVVVTGIRAAIESAISVKRNADSIVESLNAEDIGKLPDATVAESISRLPGVTAQRSSVTGKSQEISVRGMSPDFNAGLLNGREQASTGTGRGVQFDQFPAELLQSVVIYKSADSSLVNQGLASTIDMRTVRPVDYGKRSVLISLRGEHNAKAEDIPTFRSGDSKRVSLSYIDQFADRTFGVALGLTHTGGKGASQPEANTWGGWVTDTPYNGGTVKTPGGFTSRIDNAEEKRDAALATLQYKPNKNFETTLDVFYTKGSYKMDRLGLEGPVGGLSAGANDSGGKLINATVANGIATSGTFENFKGVIDNHFNDYTDELTSVGWNTKFKTGMWTLTGDLSFSDNKRELLRYETTLGIPGNTYNAADTISFSGFNGSNLADVVYKTGLNYADPNLIKLTDPQGWAGANGVQDGYYANPITRDKAQALRLSARADMTLGPISRVEFGGNYGERTKDRTTTEGALVLKGALDANGKVVDRLIAANAPGGYTGVGGLTGIPTLNWDPRGSLGTIYQLNQWTDHDIVSKNWGVKEKVSTLFVRGDIDSALGAVNLRGNVGLQLIRTQQHATGYQIDQATCDGGTHTCSYGTLGYDHSYSDVLPSLNLAAELSSDTVLRMGLGRVISRPDMQDMKAGVDVSWDGTKGRYTGSIGNPNLEPFRADALDLSAEYYFGKKGYVSLAGFYKNLKSYILKVPGNFDYTPYLTASTIAAHGASVATRDVMTQTINGSGGNINGVELAVNVPFSLAAQVLDGFGILLNYSDTHSSISMPTSGFATANVGSIDIPLPGLSRKVINMRAYYERGGFQVSVARRYRSSFLGKISDFQDNDQLVFIKGASTWDAQVGYEFQSGPAKGLSVLLSGTNLSNTEYVEFDPSSGNTTTKKKFGAAYLLGVNYKFF